MSMPDLILAGVGMIAGVGRREAVPGFSPAARARLGRLLLCGVPARGVPMRLRPCSRVARGGIGELKHTRMAKG